MNRLVLIVSILGLWWLPATATGLKACDKKQEGVAKAAQAPPSESADPHAGKPAEHSKCQRAESPPDKGKPEATCDSSEKPAVEPADPPPEKLAPTPAPPQPEPEVRVLPDTTEGLAESDPDFLFQGEYVGCTCTTRFGSEYAGLQVAALGDGQFRAVQYRHGLPGAGWNGVHTLVLAGHREGDTVRLEAQGRSGTYTVLIRRGVAELRSSAWRVLGRLERIERVSHTMGAVPPAGAIVLFDGSGTGEFTSGEIVAGNLLLAGPVTQRAFRDFHLHVEFRTPYMPQARGQGRGNSGVYLQKRYEIQILDSFSLGGEANECGGLYRQRPPDCEHGPAPPGLANLRHRLHCRTVQSAGREDLQCPHHHGTQRDRDPRRRRINGERLGAGDKETAAPGPIRFQWHGNPVVFRNMWIVESHDAEGTREE